MHFIRVFVTVIARFFISLIFLSGGINTIIHWHDMESSLMSQLGEWQSNLLQVNFLQDYAGVLPPLAPFLLAIATFLELAGALFLLLGIREKMGVIFLILFLVPVTVIMHAFWFIEGPVHEVQMIQFLKNLAILGGLLIILVRGTDNAPPMKF